MSDKISYYFRDTDVLKDNDIRAGMRKFGGPIVIALLDAIYEQAFGRNGYYLQWISEDNETASSLAEDVYLYSEEDIQRVVDIVHFFVKRGIFDECMFQSQSVLTSKRMQETFKRYRSKFKMDCTVDPRYDLTAKNTVSEQPAGNPPETRRKPAGNPPAYNIILDNNIISPPIIPPLEQCETPPEPEVARVRIDKIVKIWNEVFPEKERKVNGPPWNINSIAYESIREGESSFELAQYKTAFEQLRKHKSLSWLFHSAVKPDNLRQMLIEARNGSARGQPSDRRKVLPDRDSYPKTEEEFWQ